MLIRSFVTLALTLLAVTARADGFLYVTITPEATINATTYSGPELELTPGKYILASMPDPQLVEVNTVPDPVNSYSSPSDSSSSVRARAMAAEREVDEQLATLQTIQRTEAKLRAVKGMTLSSDCPCPCPCPPQQTVTVRACPPVQTVNYSCTGSSALSYGSLGSSAVSYGSTGSQAVSYGGSTGSLSSTFSYDSSPAIYGAAFAPAPYVRTVAPPQRTTVNIGGRPGHWTYPGSIANHLSSTHGINPAGMSREQMLNIHDAAHEGSLGGYAAYDANCPNGQCPTGNSTSVNFLGNNRRGLLGLGILGRRW